MSQRYCHYDTDHSAEVGRPVTSTAVLVTTYSTTTVCFGQMPLPIYGSRVFIIPRPAIVKIEK